jgi:hypothetical protein
MRRVMRESFMQRRVYPLFGYYPWECPLCRTPILFKKRSLLKRRSRQAEKHSPDSSFAARPNETSSTMPTAKAR